jgi:hypothetical protein
MRPDTGCRNHRQCTAETESWPTTGPVSRDEFIKNPSGMLGQRIEIVPVRLPDACACLWLGFTGLDRIGFNPDWPGHELTLTAHAIGRLAHLPLMNRSLTSLHRRIRKRSILASRARLCGVRKHGVRGLRPLRKRCRISSLCPG